MDTNNLIPNQNDQPVIAPPTPPLTPPTPPAPEIIPTPEITSNAQPNKYQGVLSNYKEETHPPVVIPETPSVPPAPVTTTTTTMTAPTPESPAMTETKTTTAIPTLDTPAPDYSNPASAQKKLEEILNTPPSPLAENAAPVGPAVDTSPKSSIFRVVFLVSLFLFFAVSAVIAYFFLKGPAASSKVAVPTPIVTEAPIAVPSVAPTVAPTLVPSGICILNDKQYKVGETFAAADGCNICSCASDLTIGCTKRVCNSTPSATSTQSAAKVTITPTKAATATPTKAL